MKNRALLEELNSLGISDKKTKKDIIKIFSGVITGKETIQEIEENKKKIFNIIMQDDSIIKKYLIENIGLSDETILFLNEYLSKSQFLDIKSLFENLRMFFSQKFQSIDMVLYRLNDHQKTLEFFLGQDNYGGNISIENIENNEYINELNSLNSNQEKFFITPQILDVNYGGIGSIKVKSLNETYIMSFYQKNFLTSVGDDVFKNDILKIKKLFDRYGLLQILKLYIKNINEVYKDELTGLFNKKYINSLSPHVKYSVIFIDLNEFKQVNDNYGHNLGDKVLVDVARILKDVVRPRDRVCRVSGDEFLILVPTNDKRELEGIKARIEKSLKENTFTFENMVTKELESFTIGGAVGFEITEPGQTLSDTIDKADVKMYNEKTGEGARSRLKQAVLEFAKPEQLQLFKECGICEGICQTAKRYSKETENIEYTN